MDVCYINIKDAFKDAGLTEKGLSEKKAEALYNKIKKVVDLEKTDPRWVNSTVDQSVQRILQEQIDDLLREKTFFQNELILNESAYTKMIDYVEKRVEERLAAGERESRTLGFTKKSRKRLYSDSVKDYLTNADLQQQIRVKDFFNKVGIIIENNPKGYKKVQSGQFDEQLLEIMKGNPVEVDSDVKQFGLQLKKIDDEIKARRQDLGLDIDDSPFVISQSKLMNWSGARSLADNFSEYKKIIRNKFDQHVDKVSTLKRLKLYPEEGETWDDLWDQFISSTAENAWYGKNEAWNSYGKSGSKFDAFTKRIGMGERIIQFKSSADEIAYMKGVNPVSDRIDKIAKQFGGNAQTTFFTKYIEELEHQGKTFGSIYELGTKGRSTFDMFRTYIRDKYKLDDDGVAEQFKNDQNAYLDSMLNIITGRNNVPTNFTVSNIVSEIKAFNNLAFLGGAAVSSITDVPSVMAELSRQGINPLKAIDGVLQNTSKEVRELFGEYAVAVQDNSWNRFGDTTSGTGLFSSLQTPFFKATLLTGWTNMNTHAYIRTLGKHLGDLKGKSWDELGNDIKWQMGRSDIGPEDWDILRSNMIKNINNKDYMAPEPDFEKLTDPKLQMVNRKLENYLLDSSQRAIPQTALRQRAMIEFESPGSVVGSLSRLFFQFKTFPLKMSQTLQFDLENPYGASKLKALTISIVGMTALGVLAQQAKGLISGRGYKPVEEYTAEDWRSALAQGGALGIVGDFTLNAFGEPSRFGGQTSLGSVMGPTFGRVEGLYNLAQKSAQGETTANQLINIGKSYVPGSNIWWGQYAINAGVVNQLHELANPGYIRRMEQKAREEGRINSDLLGLQ